MKAKKLSPIPMESILSSRCNIRVLKRAVILAPVDSFDKTITPVIWEDEND